MKETKVKLSLVVINCFCAIVWNLNLFIDLFYGYTDRTSLILHILCAILWDISAVTWLIRYRKSKKEDEQ